MSETRLMAFNNSMAHDEDRILKKIGYVYQ